MGASMFLVLVYYVIYNQRIWKTQVSPKKDREKHNKFLEQITFVKSSAMNIFIHSSENHANLKLMESN